jgi:hypothetical protein
MLAENTGYFCKTKWLLDLVKIIYNTFMLIIQISVCKSSLNTVLSKCMTQYVVWHNLIKIYILKEYASLSSDVPLPIRNKCSLGNITHCALLEQSGQYLFTWNANYIPGIMRTWPGETSWGWASLWRGQSHNICIWGGGVVCRPCVYWVYSLAYRGGQHLDTCDPPIQVSGLLDMADHCVNCQKIIPEPWPWTVASRWLVRYLCKACAAHASHPR